MPIRLAAIQPTHRESRFCGSRYWSPMNARSPMRFPLMRRIRSARRNDATDVARDGPGVVRSAERTREPAVGTDQEDGRGVIDGIGAVGTRRPDDHGDAEAIR